MRRHDDGGWGRRRGDRGVGVDSVEARELQKGMQRQGRGQFLRAVVLLLERVQRVQWGVRVRQWSPAVDRTGRGGRVHGESGGAPLDLTVVWINSSG